MADVDNPKTHIEDQVEKGEVELPRTQPESPKHEGIDPLTESDTMYPAEETRSDSEKLSRKQDGQAPDFSSADDTVAAQNNLGADEQPEDTAADSSENLAEADRAERDEAPANADGKLPKDAKVANHKSSDKQNTSASNKPATQDAPKSGRSTSSDKR
jgi:hypothetical protein